MLADFKLPVPLTPTRHDMQIPVKGGAVLSGACVPSGVDAGCYASPLAPLVWENLGVNGGHFKKRGNLLCLFSSVRSPFIKLFLAGRPGWVFRGEGLVILFVVVFDSFSNRYSPAPFAAGAAPLFSTSYLYLW